MQPPVLAVHKRKHHPAPVRHPPPQIIPLEHPGFEGELDDALREGVEDGVRRGGAVAAVDVARELV